MSFAVQRRENIGIAPEHSRPRGKLSLFVLIVRTFLPILDAKTWLLIFLAPCHGSYPDHVE